MVTNESNYINNYLMHARAVIDRISQEEIHLIVEGLKKLKKQKGRLFLLGVGGSAANCSHAVNDFRKIADIECYSPIDNISELTARTNDHGWDTVFINWLKGSRLSKKDAVMVFSVGGGNIEKNISMNIVHALDYAKKVGSAIYGIVSRDGGHTKKLADVCIHVPVVANDLITPFAESFQGLIWHLLVFHPEIRVVEPY